MPTRQITNSTYGLEVFPGTIILSEIYQLGGFSNQIKIVRMMSIHLNSCNLEQLKHITKDCSQQLVMPARQTTKATALKVFQTLYFY